MEAAQKYRGFYLLRNGMIVEAYHPGNHWLTPITFVGLQEGYTISEDDLKIWKDDPHGNLVSPDDDPLNWVGGAFGSEFDVMEKLEDYQPTQN